MDKQASFAAYNTIYTSAYGDAMKAAVISAKLMPDRFQRRDMHKSLRNKLKSAAEGVLISWQQLDSFISKGFAEVNYESKKLAAGYAYYAAAANDDWESVDSLLGDATTFISSYTAELTSGGMLGSYASDFGLLKTNFETLYEAFTDAELHAPEQTDAKITASNMVHKNLMSMFGDGQKIFRNNASVKARFTFTHLLHLVGGGRGSDTAGYDVEDFFIGPGESVIIAESLPAAADKIYMRVVKGENGVIICSTDGTGVPCTTGYALEAHVSFKDLFSELGLDISKPKLQVTNPGTEEVLLRGGKKVS